jgi:AraC-like DNA-binding protein
MIDIKKYCEYLYNTLYIPIYLYDNKELIFCYPNQKTSTLPPSTYLSTLWETDKEVAYTITQFYSYYGYIQIGNSNSCIVVGPVSSLPYSRDVLFSMLKEFPIEELKTEEFDNFFYNIPTQDLHTFLNTLLFINYTVNNTELAMKDVEHDFDFLQDNSINQKYTESSYVAKEEGIMSTDYSVETEMFRYVETGNIDGLKNCINQSSQIKVGRMADDNLRQLKNTAIVVVTLATRAAIKGGLTPSIAYNLSDIYIQQVERLTNMDVIFSLISQVLYDYTNRIASLTIPPKADNILHQVIKYVRENTNKNITVTDIANHVGFNRSYLSRKVKNELGFDLSSFIRKCKLDEAKDLLAYSDKSISEISNFLCFSSQSHLQKAFKNQYGITPHFFRKSVK